MATLKTRKTDGGREYFTSNGGHYWAEKKDGGYDLLDTRTFQPLGHFATLGLVEDYLRAL